MPLPAPTPTMAALIENEYRRPDTQEMLDESRIVSAVNVPLAPDRVLLAILPRGVPELSPAAVMDACAAEIAESTVTNLASTSSARFCISTGTFGLTELAGYRNAYTGVVPIDPVLSVGESEDKGTTGLYRYAVVVQRQLELQGERVDAVPEPGP